MQRASPVCYIGMFEGVRANQVCTRGVLRLTWVVALVHIALDSIVAVHFASARN